MSTRRILNNEKGKCMPYVKVNCMNKRRKRLAEIIICLLLFVSVTSISLQYSFVMYKKDSIISRLISVSLVVY